MKITKEEKNYIMNQVNQILDTNNILCDINTFYDVCKYYKDDIIKAFKKTQEYKKIYQTCLYYHVSKEALNNSFKIESNWYGTLPSGKYHGDCLPCLTYSVDATLKDNKNDYCYHWVNINIRGAYILSENSDKTILKFINKINSIDDIRLMSKVIKAQDLPRNTDKAPIIEHIINELVKEIKSNSISIETYKQQVIDYITAKYN